MITYLEKFLVDAKRGNVLEQDELEDEKTVENKIGKTISEVVALFTNAGVEIRIVGSLGIAAVLGASVYELIKKNTRDLDLIVIDPAVDEHVSQLLEKAALLVADNPYIAGVDQVFVHRIIQDQANTYLAYKDIRVAVDSSVIAKNNVHIGEYEIPSFYPEVMVRLLALGGPLRRKDWQKARYLFKSLREIEQVVPTSKLLPFREVTRLRREQYPRDTILGTARWQYSRFMTPERRKYIFHLERFMQSIF